MKTHQKQILAVLLCVCLLFSGTVAVFAMAGHAGHDHVEGISAVCEVCLKITAVIQRLFEVLAGNLQFLLFFLVLFCAGGLFLAGLVRVLQSPVHLRTRLDL